MRYSIYKVKDCQGNPVDHWLSLHSGVNTINSIHQRLAQYYDYGGHDHSGYWDKCDVVGCQAVFEVREAI